MSLIISESSSEKIPHNFMVKIQSVYDSLKTAEKKAMDLLLEAPDFFSRTSIMEAASKAGCSIATITRFSKKLGFSGYPELKSELNQKNHENFIPLYENISDKDNPEDVISKVFQASIQAIKDTLNTLDKEEHMRAVHLLSHAKKIVFCGAGDAAAVALSGYQKFIRIGFDVHASTDIDVQLINISHLDKNDVVVAISHSGRTKTIVDVVKFAKSNGVKVICITNFPISPLAKNSDIILLTAAFSQYVNGEIMAKRISELCIIESLFISVLLKNKSSYYKAIDLSSNASEINKL